MHDDDLRKKQSKLEMAKRTKTPKIGEEATVGAV